MSKPNGVINGKDNIMIKLSLFQEYKVCHLKITQITL